MEANKEAFFLLFLHNFLFKPTEFRNSENRVETVTYSMCVRSLEGNKEK